MPSQSKTKGKSSKKLKILSDDTARDNENLTIDEQKAIELYAATRKGKQRSSSTSEEETDDILEGIRQNIPAGRIAEVEDIVGAYLFLASDAAQHFRGQCLSPNGGDAFL